VFVQVADWPPPRVEWIYKLCAVAFLLATLWISGREPSHRSSDLLALGLWITLMVLIAPVTRKAHLIVLLLPFLAAIEASWSARPRGALLFILLAAIGLNLTSPGILGKSGSVHALAYGSLCFAMLSLWIAMALLRSRQRRLRPADDPT
jgi:hypothetical protein